jgi:type IVB pilus formation R64 PilN family outer membrane protein
MRRSGILAAACGLTVLAGCATPGQRDIESRVGGAEQRIDDVRTAHETISEPYFEISNEIYIGGAGFTRRDPTTLDARLDEHVNFNRIYPVTLNGLAEFITTEYGVPVRITADAAEAAAQAVYDPGTAFLAAEEAAAQQGGSGGIAYPSNPSGATNIAAFVIQYEGALRGFLDLIAVRTGNGWRQDAGTITLFHRDTRTWAIHALPGASTINATISNQSAGGGAGSGGGGSGGGGGGGSGGSGGAQSTLQGGNTTTTDAEINVFSAAADAIEQMLGPKGLIAKSAALGTVTVTDEAAVLDRVEAYVAQVNERVTRQVRMKVEVLSIELNTGESYGIDWNLVWESLSGRYAAVGNIAATALEGSNTVELSIVDPTDNYAGTSALVNALSRQGRVSIETSQVINTLSGQPAPVQVGAETSYLARRSIIALNDQQAQVSTELGTVSDGASITALPLVIGNNDILLQLQLNLNQLRDLRVVGSQNERLEAPQIDTRQTLQRVKIPSGGTMILSGFEQDRVRYDQRGIGTPKFQAAGGGSTGERRRTVLVVVVTANVVN